MDEYPDILAEYQEWQKTGEFLDVVEVEGYRASDIKKLAPFMSGKGVYLFLASLRSDPEECKKYIEEGFPIK